MVDHERPPGPVGPSESDRTTDPLASSLPSLLELLADTREQLVRTQLALDDAERGANRATAESGALRAEIERAASDLGEAQARAARYHAQWLEAAAGEQEARSALADLHSSRSWRITAPVRAITGLRRAHPPDDRP